MKMSELIPFEVLLEEELRDQEFRVEWERTAPARALANRLIGYRADHGLTQTGLARLLGMSQSTVFRMELGEHLPSLPTLLRLSEVLGIEIQVSMTPSGPPEDDPAAELPHAQLKEQVVTPREASLKIVNR